LVIMFIISVEFIESWFMELRSHKLRKSK